MVGIGIWHRCDDDALTAMLDPLSNVGVTPHRLTTPEPRSQPAQYPGQPFLINLAKDFSAGTTRVIRIYKHTAKGLDLAQRLDWELPLPAKVMEAIRNHSNLDKALAALLEVHPRDSVKHILIKDLRKGVVADRLIEWLSKHYESAWWYVSSKAWRPKWFETLPKDRVRLLVIPQLAARQAVEVGEVTSSWLTSGGEPSHDALSTLNELGNKFPNARCVVLPEGIRVLARDESSGAHGELKGYVLPIQGAADTTPFTPMASVFFPTLVAQMVISARSPDFLAELMVAANFTDVWERAEIRRLSREDWKPPSEQVLELNVGQPRQLSQNWRFIHWQETIEQWEAAFRDLGIIAVGQPPHEEFQLWRAMTEIEGYVTCNPKKRAALLTLFQDCRALLRMPPEERRHKSFAIVDAPGAGKSYMIECLARTFGMPYLRFNLSQVLNRQGVVDCFQAISAAQSEARENVFLVFIDEINAQPDGQFAYDLFLEPLEDGSYIYAGKTFHLEPCFWIFAGTRAPSDGPKGSDFESRLTRPVMSLTSGGSGIEDLIAIDQVYIGVATIIATFPDVSKVSRRVLKAFRLYPRKEGPRGIRRFVKSFEHVQYSRVLYDNLPRDWHRPLDLTGAVKDWDRVPEDEHKLVEIKSRPGSR